MLVPEVDRERSGAEQPRGKPPSDAELVGCGRERAKCDADDRIDDRKERSHP
jgi:hypothetical protein